MKLILSHITGNANVKAAAFGFFKANLLFELHVSLATYPGNLLGKLAGLNGFSELNRRQFQKEMQPITKMWPWFETGRVLLPKIGLSSWINNFNSPFHIDSVCQNFDRRVASKLKNLQEKGVGAIYAYEDIAGFSFAEAKAIGMKCFYDLPIGYWKAANHLMEIERERCPEYFNTIIGFNQSKAKLERKEQELSMADQIFVASTFTANTLKYNERQLAPVQVIPYGFPPVTSESRSYLRKNEKLKLLFVGSLSQRKGIAELFKAAEKLKSHVSLTIVGTKAVDDCPALNKELTKHTWIPTLSHDKILTLMRAHDVLVFPSLFEGFGLVITEAMSQGTPVITTDRTAGPDLIEQNKNGWLIEAGSAEALINQIEKLLEEPALVAEVGREAIKTAKLRPWNKYGEELAQAVLQSTGNQKLSIQNKFQ